MKPTIESLFKSTNEVRFFLPGLISFNQHVGSLQDGLASKILEDAALGREGNDVPRSVQQAKFSRPMEGSFGHVTALPQPHLRVSLLQS